MTEEQIRQHLSVVALATQTSVIEVAGERVPPLLPKSVEDLLVFWRAGCSAIAVRAGQVVGHAAVEPLVGDWHELGIVWTHPDVRGRIGGRHPHVGLRLYLALIGRHQGKDIMTTTVNPACMVVGHRAQMVPVRYTDLPAEVWRTTCCCPASKTGVERERNVPHCAIRERTCFAQITQASWQRLGCPTPCPLPAVMPSDPPHFEPDDILIILSG